MFFKNFSVSVLILAGCSFCKNANAQLWSYLGDTPAKEKAFDKYLKKEAYKVIKRHTPDADRFPYDEMIYRIRSLDSSLQYIHITQVPFTKTLSIKCATDSLEIEDCVGPARLHLLRKDLFEIVYSPRGGSDDGYENVLLLSIKNGQFRIALEIESWHDFDGTDFFELDEAHLNLAGLEPKNYQLTVKAHERRRADDKAESFDHYETYRFRYDDKLNVFYSFHVPVSGFIVDDSEKKRHVIGTFAVINLGEAKYCYINDCWYVTGRDYKTGQPTLYNYCHRPGGKSKI
ncbi:hypothetical protein [uncultured Mucilaginibacter sp.]|uniref:hypothetical protein n=1 Tax=uncultured Mucilaginibacter sp. TaxID=797541 RepID=UPI0025D1D3DC|nr:hypothetical protein [uncultured Mucilaginibacter sp.]